MINSAGLVSIVLHVCRYVDSLTAGFSISPAELASQVTEYVASSAASGWANLGAVIGGLKNTDLRWANALELKSAVESAFAEKFGTKEAAKLKGKVSTMSCRR